MAHLVSFEHALPSSATDELYISHHGNENKHSGLLRQPQLMIVQRLVKCLYSALIINPRRKAQAEGYCNRLAIFVCPSVRPSVRPSQPSFAKW